MKQAIKAAEIDGWLCSHAVEIRDDSTLGELHEVEGRCDMCDEPLFAGDIFDDGCGGEYCASCYDQLEEGDE